jgi:hypothetical protein
MKKFLAIAAIAAAMTACNNSGGGDKTDNDTIKPADTTTVITPSKDTVTVPIADTTKKDTVKHK